MDYPGWIIIGLVLSLLGALIALIFSLIGQSPGLAKRIGLGGSRMDLRVRSYTTYALALLLLAIGFFLASIPINTSSGEGEPPLAARTMEATTTSSSDASLTEDVMIDSTITPRSGMVIADTPETGSFDGPPSPGASPSAEITEGTTTAETTAVVESNEAVDPTETEATSTSEASTPTITPQPSPTPTRTPPPTLTPTPITGDTAVVSSGGSTVWITRTPGGQNVALARDGDTLIILSGHANQGGELWREVRTVSGVHGWIREIYLEYQD